MQSISKSSASAVAYTGTNGDGGSMLWSVVWAEICEKGMVLAVPPEADVSETIMQSAEWQDALRLGWYEGDKPVISWKRIGEYPDGASAIRAANAAARDMGTIMPGGWNAPLPAGGNAPVRAHKPLSISSSITPSQAARVVKTPDGGRPGTLGKAVDAVNYIVCKLDVEYTGEEYIFADKFADKISAACSTSYHTAYGTLIGNLLQVLDHMSMLITDEHIGENPEQEERNKQQELDACYSSVRKWMDPEDEQHQQDLLQAALQVCNELIQERNQVCAEVSNKQPIRLMNQQDLNNIARLASKNRMDLRSECPLYESGRSTIPYLDSAMLPKWWYDWDTATSRSPIIDMPCGNCGLRMSCFS